MSFNLGMVTNYADDYRLNVAMVGFPQSLNNSFDSHDERLSWGEISEVTDNTIKASYDSSGGQSGSPIYTVEYLNGKEYHTVVGIYTLGYNEYSEGVRIDPYILKFFTDTTNINY